VRLLLDAGALIALERADRAAWARLKSALAAREAPTTHGGILAEVWRGGRGRQAWLARALAGIDVVPLDARLGRAAGALIGRNGAGDAMDAALVALAADDDVIVTSDPHDLQRLVAASSRHVDVVPA